MGIVASSEYRQLGYALASAPHGLIRTTRQAGWGLRRVGQLAAHVRIVDALVVNPEVPDAAVVRAALIERLIAELTDDMAGNGRLYGSTEDLPERVQFWRELGFRVKSRILRRRGNIRDAHIAELAASPGFRPFTKDSGAGRCERQGGRSPRCRGRTVVHGWIGRRHDGDLRPRLPPTRRCLGASAALCE